MKPLFQLLCVLLFTTIVKAQAPKNDIVLKTNGEELIGTVTEVTDSLVKFKYVGEATVYTFKKKDLLKITHASGRVELFKPATPSVQNTASPTIATTPSPASNSDHHNKVAILPFGFIKDNQDAGPTMALKVQTEAYTYLRAHSAGYTILDPRTTNAILIKAGITRDKMAGYTMQEICNTLGVEYVVDGMVTQNRGVQTSSSSGSYRTNSDGNIFNGNKSGSTFSSATSAQTYVTSIAMNVYTDTNNNIFSQDHKAFLASTDGSYSSTLTYLLKRTPLYRK